MKAKIETVYSALIRKESGWYVAECPESGTASQGKTVEEALGNLREATELYLEEFPRQDAPHFFVTTFNVAIHA